MFSFTTTRSRRNCFRLYSALATVSLLMCVSQAHAQFKILDDPLGTIYTSPNGISGCIVVGDYYSLAGQHGYLYNIYDGQYTTYDVPVLGAQQTQIKAVDGNEFVGTFYDSSNHMHGFEDSFGGIQGG